MPGEVDDRGKDILEPLFAFASVLPKWVKHRLVEAAQSIARDRKDEEGESDAIVLGLQILKERFPMEREVWHLRTEKAFDLFSGEISSVETKSQAQALLRKMGFRSKRVRVGDRVLRGYKIASQTLKKLCERYALGAQAA